MGMLREEAANASYPNISQHQASKAKNKQK